MRDRCKICGGQSFDFCAHTARCRQCDVLLYWPYPPPDTELMHESQGKARWLRKDVLGWYALTAFRNHHNFTNMLRFALDESYHGRPIDILDYGGGGGQFAMVCASHFPQSVTYITDISDVSLLDEWRPMNRQIRFADFPQDATKFDAIFMNDVFEHVSDPVGVLTQLAGKLKPGGRIFIDTPMQFWIYPVSKWLSGALYTKVLRGTVTTGHLQIWSRRAFELAVEKAGLSVSKYREVSEYTLPASQYLNGMGIRNPLMRFGGAVFYRFAKYLARNKIISVLTLR